MKTLISALFIILSIMVVAAQGNAATGDETLFATSNAPDVLIFLDKSGSMRTSMDGTWEGAHPWRIDTALDVIKGLLDGNKDGTIDARDEDILRMRLGYMRFASLPQDQPYDDGNPLGGYIKVLADIGSHYSDIWSQVNNGERAQSATSLTQSLKEIQTYMDYFKNPANHTYYDAASVCRQRFVIFVTDGEESCWCPTVAPDPPGVCCLVGYYCTDDQWKRRLATVYQSKLLHDAGYQVFWVGFAGGGLDVTLQRTLHWAAYHGGTRDPNALQTFAKDALGKPVYKIENYITGGDAGNACSTSSSLKTPADPATYDISGYGFMATSSTELSAALRSILKYITEKSYSFTAPTTPTVRIVDNESVYISSLIPSDTPFWKGNVKAYQLNTDGTLSADANGIPLDSKLLWDAEDQLWNLGPDARKIYTYKSGARVEFKTANITRTDLSVPTDADRDKLVNHIRGWDTYDIDGNLKTYPTLAEKKPWQLGDFYHSNSVIVGEPSRFYVDDGYSTSGGFYSLYKTTRTKVLIQGANDGMLHAFDATTGVEKWAFIPNFLLKSLKNMVGGHTYYVDASPKVADVWFYSDTDPYDTTKEAGEWRTVLVCGVRKGGKQYFALNITDTLNPQFLWEFPKSTDTVTLAKMGQSWSEPAIGRVKVEGADGNLYERWVAFIGGGYDRSGLGRAFFVVDMKTGNIIWQVSTAVADPDPDYAIVTNPTVLDVDGDGYIDKVYLGDLGGQMWVIDVSYNKVSNLSNSLWNAKMLFQAPAPVPEKHPIYYQPAVTLDPSGTIWVYFGTGDRENPTDTNNKENFYAVKDDGGYTAVQPYKENDLKKLGVTSDNTYSKVSTEKGWRIELSTSEKVLARPAVFNGLVYFTTFTPITTDPCSAGGDAKLYIVEYLSGGGATDTAAYLLGTTSSRFIDIGGGVPSAPIISVNMKGQGSVIVGTTASGIYSSTIHSHPTNKELIYWREVIR
jgi:hypothetical protein